MNVRNKGASVMLLVSSTNDFDDENNFDDKLGEKVDIPTVIIRSSVGDKIKKYIESNTFNKPIMSIKFSGRVWDNGNFKMEMFLRSDDVKSLHFFKEFNVYYQKLSKY